MLKVVLSKLRRHFFKLVALVAFSCCFTMWFFHVHYFVNKQKESPFDHLTAKLFKPYYSLRCPGVNQHSHLNCTLPKMFMISARPEAERRQSQTSWSHHNVNRIDTGSLSRNLTTHSECSKPTWSNRLFSIYRTVFRDILGNNMDDKDFIFIEDDVLLMDFESLQKETCLARQNRLQFYSFFKPSAQGQSCLYQHGTLAFYANHHFLHHLTHDVSQSKLCRLPIDMYIASIGPWYSTTKEIVKHNAISRFNLKRR